MIFFDTILFVVRHVCYVLKVPIEVMCEICVSARLFFFYEVLCGRSVHKLCVMMLLAGGQRFCMNVGGEYERVNLRVWCLRACWLFVAYD